VSTAAWGGLLGGLAGLGVVLVVLRVGALRRPALTSRVLPYLRDLPASVAPVRPGPEVAVGSTSAIAGIFGPLVVRAAELVERLLGGAASVRRRLRRAGLTTTVQEFRVEQVLWGLGGFAIAAGAQLLQMLSGAEVTISALPFALMGFVAGVLLRDNRLSSVVRRREQEIVTEFPTIAELLALAVAAGESPVAALDRVVRRSRGALSEDLAAVLARIRTGEPVSVAFDRFASDSGIPLVSRFATGVAVSVERGTPLAEVLHAQAADVREAGRRQLIESAARKEVAMMAPVVFLVLPTVIVFAFFPGAIGLRLIAP
jgi:tight adherence protein C